VNKQLVNLIGGAAALAIVILGVVVFAVPLYSTASTTNGEANRVASQNDTQQAVLDGLAAQAADTTELDADVDELRAEIPRTAHLDDVLYLAVQAAQAHGGTVTALTKGDATAFAARTAEVEASASGGTAPPPAASDASASGSASGDASAAGADPAATGADEATQIPVTVTIDAPDVAAATQILDALRAGPRLVAVQQGAVTTKPEGGVTLTAALLAFSRA
jgi:hypothetical protein